MINILGHKVEVTEERICQRSGADHIILKHEARADRQENNFNVDDSYTLCLRCGKAISLFVKDI